jgi:hypothetical protein
MDSIISDKKIESWIDGSILMFRQSGSIAPDLGELLQVTQAKQISSR